MLETSYLCYWLMYVKTTDLYWFIKILNWKFCHIGALPRFCLLQIAVGQCFNWARLAPHPLAPEITRYIKFCQSGLNPSRIMFIIAIVSWWRVCWLALLFGSQLANSSRLLIFSQHSLWLFLKIFMIESMENLLKGHWWQWLFIHTFQ